MNKRALSIGLIAAGAFAFGAAAQITPIGPFTGDYSEGFEGQPQVLFEPCVSTTWGVGIFGDTADLCTPGNSGCHTTGSWGFFCSLGRRTGSWMYGSAGGFSQITFNDGAGAFGGYFGSNAYDVGEQPNATFTFYDVDGNVLGDEYVEFDRCVWEWFGWEFDVPVYTIDCVNGKYSGAFLMMEDLEYNVGGPSDCLTMTVDALFGGGSADWDVSGATPGAEVAIVYGFNPGSTVINGYAQYCASFGIDCVNQKRVICRKTADGNGEISCTKRIPGNAVGVRVLSQAAERGTCPDECISNLDDQTIQ